MGILKRCATCGQLVDWDDLAEAVHHGPVPHGPMPGFTDDRSIQPQLDFVGPRPRSLGGWPRGKMVADTRADLSRRSQRPAQEERLKRDL